MIGCSSSNVLGLAIKTLIESEMSRYTGDIVKQWVCDKVFDRSKASKDVLTAIQACALHKAFLLITGDKPMKKDEKWQMLSELSVEQSENFITHNFEGVKGIPSWCNNSFVSKKDLKADGGKWIVNKKRESGWKRVQDDVRVMRNELAPLWMKFLAQHNAGKGGILNKIPSGTALIELLEKWHQLL